MFLHLHTAFFLTYVFDILFWHSICIYSDIPCDILSGTSVIFSSILADIWHLFLRSILLFWHSSLWCTRSHSHQHQDMGGDTKGSQKELMTNVSRHSARVASPPFFRGKPKENPRKTKGKPKENGGLVGFYWI